MGLYNSMHIYMHYTTDVMSFVSLLLVFHSAAFTECNSLNDAPVIVYVSKMFPVPKEALPGSKSR